MANIAGVEIVNDRTDEFMREFRQKKKQILVKWGEGVEGQAKLQIESNPRRVDTGRLRDSITYATKTKHDDVEPRAKSEDAVNKDAADEDSVVIGTNVEYGIYVHNGTSKMRANRFLNDAVENLKSRGEFEKVVRELLNDFIL